METDLTQLLPEDVLVDVLRLLPPHSLAAARCVRKAWHAAIDERRLLGLVPPSLAGIFINFFEYDISEFFSHPSPEGAAISCKLNYITEDNDLPHVWDHCNGLLLLEDLVVNPATRSRVTLPPRPPSRMEFYNFLEEDFIVFDPIVSSHFEVFIIPNAHYQSSEKLDTTIKEREWPPSLLTVDVYSSVTSKWEERSFVRQGGSIWTVADFEKVWPDREQYTAYWRGELYVYCHLVMRFSLSDCTYQVLKPPKDIEDIDLRSYPELHLGRSENGVYFASLEGHNYRLRVWILKESCGQTEWVLKNDNYLDHAKPRGYYNQHIHGPWVLQDLNYEKFKGIPGLKNDIDKLREYNYKVEEYDGCISILGFHPFKEIVFLSKSLKRGLAYDLNTSKLEDMGNLYPKHYDYFAYFKKIEKSFPYTPCWIGGGPWCN